MGADWESDLLVHLKAAEDLLMSREQQKSDCSELEFRSWPIVQRLYAALEPPKETILRHGYMAASQQACLQIAIDLGIFHTLAEKRPSAVSATALAIAAMADESLIVRIMRVLVSLRFAGESDVQVYHATPLTETMTQPAFEAAVRSCSNDTVQIAAKLPAYLKARRYQLPPGHRDCPFQWAVASDLTYFDWVKRDKRIAQDLQCSMEAMRFSSYRWIDWYPVQTNILDKTEKGDREKPLIVDVGGGQGQDVQTFLDRFPQAHGRLVLQDLSTVVLGLAISGIQIMPYSFFDAQPVKGANVYFFHNVFHNWSDNEALEILNNTKSAMDIKESCILLNETVLPDRGCPAINAAQDINMMCILGGQKRSQRQWSQLIEKAGLVVVQFWFGKSPVDDAIIEVVCPDPCVALGSNV